MQFIRYAFIFELTTTTQIILKGENIVIRIVHIIFTQMMNNFFSQSANVKCFY